MSRKQDSYEHVYAKNRAAFRAWLERNHTQKESIWLVFYKSKSGKPTIKYDEAVEEALCFGWIDSKINSIDEERYKLIFSPRKPKSPWSRVNKTRLKKLIAENLMTPAGLEKVEQAKKDGSWSVLDDVEDLIVPDDLANLFEQYPTAKANYKKFSDSVKKAILWWIKSAKRAETRERRIQKTVEAAEENIKIKP